MTSRASQQSSKAAGLVPDGWLRVGQRVNRRRRQAGEGFDMSPPCAPRTYKVYIFSARIMEGKVVLSPILHQHPLSPSLLSGPSKEMARRKGGERQRMTSGRIE